MKGHHMAATILTAERLREVLDYNPDTGVFVWKLRTGPRGRVGKSAGTHNTCGHIQIRIDGRLYLAHRLAWLYVNNVWPANQIDHINGIRDNNQLENLRDVSGSVNMQNQRIARLDNKCGLLGVNKKGNRWEAKISVVGKNHYLGLFATPKEAHAAYIEAKRRLHSGCTI
jgi:hypothetical protein